MHAGHYPEVSDDFGHWLAGFIDGEGCFGIQRHVQGSYRPRFDLGLRIDDRATLEEIQARTGLGSLYVDRARKRRNPNAEHFCIWVVSVKQHCAVLITLLERYPLRSKKKGDFEIWAQAVRLWAKNGQRGGRVNDWSGIRQLKDELQAYRRAGLSSVPVGIPTNDHEPQPLWGG